MHLIGVWLLAMVSHWQSWLSGGGLGGFALVVILYIEKFHPRGWTMPKRWHAVLIGAFFVLGASFMTWKDQYDHTQSALTTEVSLRQQIEDLNKPNLNGIIERVMTGTQPSRHGIIITIEAQIANLGTPSIADDFDEYFHKQDGSVHKGEMMLQPTGPGSIVLYFKGGPPLYIEKSDFLPRLALENPIPRGGAIPGYIQFFYVNLAPSDVDHGDFLDLQFSDAWGGRHHAKVKFSGSKDPEPF